MNCEFKKRDDGYYECVKCGFVLKASDPSKIYSVCPGAPRQSPTFIKKVAHYVAAVAEHVASGMETCTDEETEERLSICKSCEKYDKDDERCAVCGCKANANRNAFLNKLRMKSQSCPKGLW